MKVKQFNAASAQECVAAMGAFLAQESAIPVKSEPIEGGGIRLWFADANQAGVAPAMSCAFGPRGQRS